MDCTNTILGIELGSTRIKAVLIDAQFRPIAQGSFDWENSFVNGVWTYPIEEVHQGLKACYKALKQDFAAKFGETLKSVGAIGISAMMHGYLPFDKAGNLLTEFRTWRNTMTADAARELTELFSFNIPQRWSIAHLYQAILNNEEHVPSIDHINTLAGYVHECLTGHRVVGIGEASGIFPIDSDALGYDREMIAKFEALPKVKPLSLSLDCVLPAVRLAGDRAGTLTPEGAAFLDPDGDLVPGIPFAPPEGDAGTGMVATNSVAVRTGNVSAGTSDFAMVVVDHMPKVHREIDMVTTPDGKPVAMVHCNNCTSDINAWMNLFAQFAGVMGMPVDRNTLYTRLFQQALLGDADCNGLISYNYLSGESVTDLDEGRPVFLRTPNANLSLPNFMRTHLFSALATLKIGLDLLIKEENVPIDRLYGHGGYFKTPEVGQRFLSAAVAAPVSVMETAGEGGPYGMALLSAYMLWKRSGETLESFLEKRVFADAKSVSLMADERDIEGFERFIAQYKKSLPVEQAAIKTM